MNATGKLLNSLQIFLASAARVAQERSINGLDKTFDKARLGLRKISRHIEEPNFSVAFVGMTGVGKSTLLSALFGEDCAPIRNGPCQSAVVNYSYSDDNLIHATVLHEGFRPLCRKSCDNMSQLVDLLNQFAVQGGGDAGGGVLRVEVKLPVDILKCGLKIIDTPGFGAAEEFGGQVHQNNLLAHLPRVHRIFWVVSDEQQITATEKKFHDEHLAGLDCCETMVVNVFGDDWEQKDRQRFRSRFVNQVNPFLSLFFVNAKVGLKGKMDNKPDFVDASRITELESKLKSIATPEGRAKSFIEDIVNIVECVAWHADEKNMTLNDFNLPIEAANVWADAGEIDEVNWRRIERLFVRP